MRVAATSPRRDAAGCDDHGRQPRRINASTANDESQALGLVAVGGDASFTNVGDVDAASANGVCGRCAGRAKYGTRPSSTAGTSADGGLQASAWRRCPTATCPIDNSGHIDAYGPYAVGISLYASGTNTVHNTGSIVATGALESSFAIMGGDGIEQITNAGDLVGAL
jgi:hypothetical protein